MERHELEGELREESVMITSSVLPEENPLDESEMFKQLMLACGRGDLRKCQDLVSQGVNVNGRDSSDYTPLIIASRCGHYGLVEFLLESGALAERNTVQGERCIYNALNAKVRSLLLQYDFSKTSDPYFYWSTHISGLLSRTTPWTSDISLTSDSDSFNLHKFILASRTPYFQEKLEAQPDTSSWNLAASVPVEAIQIVLRYIYLGDLPNGLVPPGSSISEEEVARGLDKISKQLDVDHVREVISTKDSRLARQRFQKEKERAAKQLGGFFKSNVLGHKMVVDTDCVNDTKWKYDNPAFADVLLRSVGAYGKDDEDIEQTAVLSGQGIPIGAAADPSRQPRKSTLYPVHKAILIRSKYFEKMFSGEFVESQRAEHLRIVTIKYSPTVVELVLTFLYTENTVIPLEHALEVLYAADMLLLDSLKSKAARAITTLCSGTSNVLVDRTHKHTNGDGDAPQQADEQVEMEPINIYDVVHTAWDLGVQGLEEFSARYLAYRLEDYIDDLDFQDLIRESAGRIKKRAETDTIKLLDEIRYYLSERFPSRFENAGADEMIQGDKGEVSAGAAAVLADNSAEPVNGAGVQADGGATNGEDGSKPGDAVVTLNGETAEDEFVSDAVNYQLLLKKIDAMLERLNLDA